MTSVYFIRHAQPVHTHEDDRTRPLSADGIVDIEKVTEFLSKLSIDCYISSPYKRSIDTISTGAKNANLKIHIDERLRERQKGDGGNNHGMFQKRWADFSFHEQGGESLAMVQKRNMDALFDILKNHKDKKIVVGTHGTALSTILNYYNPSFGCDDFLRIIDFMPYIIRLDFDGETYIGQEELLIVEKEFIATNRADIPNNANTPPAKWSERFTEPSRREGRFFARWKTELARLLICPVLPAGISLGMVALLGVPVLIIAFAAGVLTFTLGSAVSAYIRLRFGGGIILSGARVVYTGNRKEAFWLCLKPRLLNLATLGLYWLSGFGKVGANKARYSGTTRSGEALPSETSVSVGTPLSSGTTGINRSGFFGNFLQILAPKIVLTAVPAVILYFTGIIPLRKHSDAFWNELARQSTRFRPPNMELWGLIKSLAKNGFIAFYDPVYYHEVTSIIWTLIMLFAAYFLLYPWYRHKINKWEKSHASVDGYRLKYGASFGAYAGNAYVNLLIATVPAGLLVFLYLQRNRIVPAALVILTLLTALALLAALAYASLRAAGFDARNTAVAAPPGQAWEYFMVPEETLHRTAAESVKRMFGPESRRRAANYLRSYGSLYALLLIPVVYLIVFKYIPMFFIQIGFKQNNIVIPVEDVSWAGEYGFGWLINAFRTRDFYLAVRNTLMLNGLDLLLGFPAPVILALLLNELAFKKFKRVSQTVFYMPHFLSWVIIAALAIQLFDGSYGLVNMVFKNAGLNTIAPFEENAQWVAMYVLLGIWQSAGWGTIIYLAAITGINPELYEASSVDGANRLRKIWHITLPGIRATIIILLIMRLGHIVGSDFERPFSLRNPVITQVSDVLSIYIYQRGIRGNQFSLTAAVGIFQSVICLIFLFSANALAKRFGERGVW